VLAQLMGGAQQFLIFIGALVVDRALAVSADAGYQGTRSIRRSS